MIGIITYINRTIFFSLKNHYASNDGSKEGYKYTNSNKIKMFAKELANRDKKKDRRIYT